MPKSEAVRQEPKLETDQQVPSVQADAVDVPEVQNQEEIVDLTNEGTYI